MIDNDGHFCRDDKVADCLLLLMFTYRIYYDKEILTEVIT